MSLAAPKAAAALRRAPMASLAVVAAPAAVVAALGAPVAGASVLAVRELAAACLGPVAAAVVVKAVARERRAIRRADRAGPDCTIQLQVGS
jgi:hypothetical protein